MKTIQTSLWIGLLAGATFVFAGEPSPRELTGTIQSVSYWFQRIKVVDNEGRTHLLQVASDRVKLARFKKGDKVHIRYLEPVAYFLIPPGTDAEQVRELTQGTTAVKTQELTATVEELDQANRRLTLREPNGNAFQVKAGPNAGFSRLKIGDQISARCSQAVALDLNHV